MKASFYSRIAACALVALAGCATMPPAPSAKPAEHTAATTTPASRPTSVASRPTAATPDKNPAKPVTAVTGAAAKRLNDTAAGKLMGPDFGEYVLVNKAPAGLQLVVGTPADSSKPPRLRIMLLRDGKTLLDQTLDDFPHATDEIRSDLECEQRSVLGSIDPDGTVHAGLECQSGEDSIETVDVEALFEVAPSLEAPAKLRWRWSGKTTWMESNQVTGCARGENVTVHLVNGQPKVTRGSWSEREFEPEEGTPKEKCEFEAAQD